MTSATFFPARWPTSTFAPGLHNLEIHAEQCSSARGWSAARSALFLQVLYAETSPDDADIQSFFHYDEEVYILGRGPALLCFLDEIEAKYKEITVVEAWVNRESTINTVVINGQCEEELVPGSQNRGHASQFAWAFRWRFKKSIRSAAEREYNQLLSEVD